jgi:hypothetical protein
MSCWASALLSALEDLQEFAGRECYGMFVIRLRRSLELQAFVIGQL